MKDDGEVESETLTHTSDMSEDYEKSEYFDVIPENREKPGEYDHIRMEMYGNIQGRIDEEWIAKRDA